MTPLRTAVQTSLRSTLRLPALSTATRSLAHLPSLPSPARPTVSNRLPTPSPHPIRLYSNPSWSSSGEITYSELKPETEHPSGEITLIDVREPNEVAEGIVPSAVNVPLSQFKEAFKTDREADDFQRRFAFSRPEFGDKIVVYCRSGKRSGQAMEHLKSQGWKNVRNYTGSYLDWVKQEEANKTQQSQDDD